MDLLLDCLDLDDVGSKLLQNDSNCFPNDMASYVIIIIIIIIIIISSQN
jgi:hypothetical protein